MQPDPQEMFSQLGPFLMYLGVLALIGYVLCGVILTMLANKTNTPNAWMAWVPILSAILLCRIGRRSAWLLLLLIVPLVNIAVMIYIFMGVAEARGKPPVSAFLMLVPIVNFFVLIWLASGPAATPRQAAQPFVPGAQPSVGTPSYAAAGTSLLCAHCGDPFEANEMYCGNCGMPRPVVSAGATPPPFQPAVPSAVPSASSGRGAKIVAAVGGAILVAFGGWMGVSRIIKPMLGGGGGGTGTVTSSGLPERPSGVLTEFPVDTDRKSPAKPVSVSTVRLRGGRVDLPKGLPPGLTPAVLAQVAESVSSASYSTSPNEPPVDVHVIESDQPAAAEQIAQAVIQGGGGITIDVGVQVVSPTGQVYRGRKIRTVLGALVYVLGKAGTNVIMLIHAASAAAAPLADRLAANVGNGGGLYDYARVAGAVGLLPPSLPMGLSLQEMKSYSGSELVNVEELRKTLGADVESIRRYVPDRLTSLRYADSSRREWKVLSGDYGSSMKSWITWSTLRFTSGVSGLQSISSGGVDGLTLVQDRERFLLLRNGSVLTLVVAPGSEAVDRVATFARQIAR